MAHSFRAQNRRQTILFPAEGTMTTAYLDSIECSDQPLDLSFHPKEDNLVALALVDGTVEVHDIREEKVDDDDEADSILSSMAIHKQMIPQKDSSELKQASCRAISFSTDGQRIYSGGAAGDLCAIDAEIACTFSSNQSRKSLLWSIEGAAEGKYTPIQVLHPFQQSPLLVTGDDAGGVRIWDERLCGSSTSTSQNGINSLKRPQGCVMSWKENKDYISDLDHSDDGNTLLATSADGRLSVFDLRKPTTTTNQQSNFRLSDDQEDELLSVKIIKNGKKVVCGSQEGVLGVFSWGTWGDVSDRFPGHPSSIDALVKVDEDTLLTGSSDGWIRLVSIHPDKFLGVLGEDHGGFPIEKLEFNSSRHILGSLSHDCRVRLCDARILDDSFEENEEEDAGKMDRQPTNKSTSVTANVAASTGNSKSDDEWESSDDLDDDESDSDDSDRPSTNQKRAKRLKTDNEKFFEDL